MCVCIHSDGFTPQVERRLLKNACERDSSPRIGKFLLTPMSMEAVVTFSDLHNRRERISPNASTIDASSGHA